jgi:hypothetical protein
VSVFQDIADAIVAQLRTDPDLPPARADDDGSVPLAQNRAADVLVTLGISSESMAMAAYTDWRTDVIVEITARPVGQASAAAMCDRYLARVFDHLRAGNAELMGRLAPLAVIGINQQSGDRRIRRDVTRTDSAMAHTEYSLAVYHRTVADTLTPWPV